jgi:hypothetical protein
MVGRKRVGLKFDMGRTHGGEGWWLGKLRWRMLHGWWTGEIEIWKLENIEVGCMPGWKMGSMSDGDFRLMLCETDVGI